MRRLIAIASVTLAMGCATERLPAHQNDPDAAFVGSVSDGSVDGGYGGVGGSGGAGLGSGGNQVIDAGSGAAGYGDTDGGLCTPGIPRCHGDFGYQQCEQEGTWGPPHSCEGYSSNGTSSYCVTTVPTDTSEAWAACVDPACWYWITAGFVPGPTPAGICTSSTTLKQCNAGGTLSNATCDGVCTQVGVLDGRILGYCSPQCSDGARECLGGSLYRECAGGSWLAEPKVCEGGALCNPLGSGALPDIHCGGNCDPGTSRCTSDSTGIEVCTNDSLWEVDPNQQCLIGACRPAGPQAQCQADCSPGQFQCAYEGAPNERACNEQYLWAVPTDCAVGSTCRSSGGQGLGCVECVGSENSAGNDYGVSDSRCSEGELSRCGDDNLLAAFCAVQRARNLR